MKYMLILFFIVSNLTGCTTTAEQSPSQKSMMEFIVSTLVNPEASNEKRKSYFEKMRKNDPGNTEYFNCIEKKLSMDAIRGKLIQGYQSLIPPESVIAIYNLLKSDSGKTYARIIKAGPPYDKAKSQLSPQEALDFEKTSQEFNKYINEETAVKFQEIAPKLAIELREDAKEACSSQYKSFYPI